MNLKPLYDVAEDAYRFSYSSLRTTSTSLWPLFLYFCFAHFFILIPEIVFIFKESDNWDATAEALADIGLHFAALTNLWYFYGRSNKARDLFEWAKKLEKLQRQLSVENKSIEKKIAIIRLVARSSKFMYLASAYLMIISKTYKTLFFGERNLLSYATLPYDWRKSPWFEITCIIQATAIQDAATSHYAVDGFYFIVLGLLFLSLNILRYDLEDLFLVSLLNEGFSKDRVIDIKNESKDSKTDKRNEIWNERIASIEERTLLKKINKITDTHFIELIKRHQELLNFAECMNDFFWPILLLQVLFNMYYLISLPLMALLTENRTLKVAMWSRVIDAVFRLFLTTFSSQLLISESLKFQDTVYDCPWYMCDMKHKNSFLITLIRCSKPVQVTTGGFLNLDLEVFISIIKLSVSSVGMFRELIEYQRNV